MFSMLSGSVSTSFVTQRESSLPVPLSLVACSPLKAIAPVCVKISKVENHRPYPMLGPQAPAKPIILFTLLIPREAARDDSIPVAGAPPSQMTTNGDDWLGAPGLNQGQLAAKMGVDRSYISGASEIPAQGERHALSSRCTHRRPHHGPCCIPRGQFRSSDCLIGD
jgi:hypothetical protein